jgi:hypothetical protein
VKNGNHDSLTISFIYDTINSKIISKKNYIIENADSLLISKSYRKYYPDSVYIRPLEKLAISKRDIQNFTESISSIDLSKQNSKLKQNILDGITIGFKFSSGQIKNRFRFRCPDPSDSAEFKLIKALFNLFESSFKTELTTNYIEHLKGYFDFGLLVKHISDNPLEYRFYDNLSENDYDELYKLLDSLPTDRPIIFDFSNFLGMGTMFYDDFEDLIDENPNIYWIVSDKSIQQIKEIGVKRNRIFRDRTTLLRKLKNAP